MTISKFCINLEIINSGQASVLNAYVCMWKSCLSFRYSHWEFYSVVQTWMVCAIWVVQVCDICMSLAWPSGVSGGVQVLH